MNSVRNAVFVSCVLASSFLVACTAPTGDEGVDANGSAIAAVPGSKDVVVDAAHFDAFNGKELRVTTHGGHNAVHAKIAGGRATVRLPHASLPNTFGTTLYAFIDANNDGTCDGADVAFMFFASPPGASSNGEVHVHLGPEVQFAASTSCQDFYSSSGTTPAGAHAAASLPEPGAKDVVLDATNFDDVCGQTLRVLAVTHARGTVGRIEAAARISAGKATVRLRGASLPNTFGTTLYAFVDANNDGTCNGADIAFMLFANPPGASSNGEVHVHLDRGDGSASPISCQDFYSSSQAN